MSPRSPQRAATTERRDDSALRLQDIAQQLADRGGLRWVGAYLAVAGAVTLAGLAAAPASAAGD